jgi:hypothetical protein
MKRILSILSIGISSLFSSEVFLDSEVILNESGSKEISYFCDTKSQNIKQYIETESGVGTGVISVDINQAYLYKDSGERVLCSELENYLISKLSKEAKETSEEQIPGDIPENVFIVEENILNTSFGVFNIATFCQNGYEFQLVENEGNFSTVQIFDKSGIPKLCK